MIDAAPQNSVASDMENYGTIVLSALCVGVALAGISSTTQSTMGRSIRWALIAVYGCFAGLLALPVVGHAAPGFLEAYLPLCLAFLLALPAAVYLFIAARCAAPARVPIHWGHALFPVIGACVAIGYWLLPYPDRVAMFRDGELPAGAMAATLALLTFGLISIWQAVAGGYVFVMLRRLRTHRADLKLFYSNTSARDMLWVDWFILSLFATWVAATVYLATSNYPLGFTVSHHWAMGVALGMLILLNSFSLTPLPPEPTAEPAAPQQSDTPKYARSALTSDHAVQLAKRIDTAMRKDQLYLDPNLSLKTLSQHVGARPNLISQTLNEQIGETFFDYVARWRIEASKPMLDAHSQSVLTIAYEVGFNSRSTFYKAFKRETGMTPKAYRAMAASAA